eukprot:15456208-Alexandrium_andersonii.AAC.1
MDTGSTSQRVCCFALAFRAARETVCNNRRPLRRLPVPWQPRPGQRAPRRHPWRSESGLPHLS